MDLKEFGIQLAKLGLPILGSALGPGGTVLGAKLGEAIGQKDKSPEAILATLTGNPEALQKAREFEAKHKITLLKLTLDHEYKLRGQEFADTADARAMQGKALAQEDLFSKRFIYFFASFWSAITVVYIFCITFINIPKENVHFSDIILGFLLGTLIATIINFFFGSTHSSKGKDDSISKLSNMAAS